MLKRILSIVVCFIIVISCCSCFANPQKHSAQKILIIGNSHSVDAFYLLYQAYKDQNPDRELCLGILYYTGCSITKHISFAKSNDKVYRYYKNDNGVWEITNHMDMQTVLKEQQWDTVMLQAAKSDLDDTLNLSGRRELENIVNQEVKNPHQFVWHTSWPSPNDETFFAKDYVRQAPEGYKENLIRLYGFDPVQQFTVLTEKAKVHILSDKTYAKAICTGSAIMHTYLVQKKPQRDLWRDYTHLSDFGRIIAAYAITAQLTEKPIKAISISKIPVKLRHKQYRDLGDMKLTKKDKNIIIQAVNYSLKNPFTVPN